MELAALIARYGYAAVFIGTLLEGETVLLLAGYAAHRAYLDWTGVVMVAWLGSTLGDQLWFGLGRWQGRRLLALWPGLDARMSRALSKIETNPNVSILAMRFLWGLRIALPLALGMSRVSWRRFFWLNLVSAGLWAVLIAGLGWSFGNLVERYASRIYHDELAFFAVVIVGTLLAQGVFRWREHTRSHHPEP